MISGHKKKVKWFKNRIKKLGGNLKDFEEAKIIVDKSIENVKLKFKGKIFQGSKSY